MYEIIYWSLLGQLDYIPSAGTFSSLCVWHLQHDVKIINPERNSQYQANYGKIKVFAVENVT